MKNNYIIIGDSIAYGIGDYESNGWVSLLKNKLLNEDGTKECNSYTHCIGFPGATSKDILEKVDNIVKTFYSDETNNTIIVSIGINDTQIYEGKSKVDIEKYKSNIKGIINALNKYNSNIIFLGLTGIECVNEPFLWKPNKYYDNKEISKYDEELEKLCNDYAVKYISMDNILKASDFIDGLHPNHNGHKKITERVLASIK